MGWARGRGPRGWGGKLVEAEAKLEGRLVEAETEAKFNGEGTICNPQHNPHDTGTSQILDWLSLGGENIYFMSKECSDFMKRKGL